MKDCYNLPKDVLFRLDIVRLKKGDDVEGVETRTMGRVKTPAQGFFIVKMIASWLMQWSTSMLVSCGVEEGDAEAVAQLGEGKDAKYMHNGKFIKDENLEDLR